MKPVRVSDARWVSVGGWAQDGLQFLRHTIIHNLPVIAWRYRRCINSTHQLMVSSKYSSCTPDILHLRIVVVYISDLISFVIFLWERGWRWIRPFVGTRHDTPANWRAAAILQWESNKKIHCAFVDSVVTPDTEHYLPIAVALENIRLYASRHKLWA